jgi:hypothetical protein
MLAQLSEGAASVVQAAGFSPVIFAANLGVAGLMLYWFAVRMERLHETGRVEVSMRMSALEKSADRLAKAQLITLMSLGRLDSVAKDQAQQLLDEITSKETRE